MQRPLNTGAVVCSESILQRALRLDQSPDSLSDRFAVQCHDLHEIRRVESFEQCCAATERAAAASYDKIHRESRVSSAATRPGGLGRRVDELEVDLLQRDARALRKERPGLKIRNPDAVEEWSNAEVFLHVTLTSDVTNFDDV